MIYLGSYFSFSLWFFIFFKLLAQLMNSSLFCSWVWQSQHLLHPLALHFSNFLSSLSTASDGFLHILPTYLNFPTTLWASPSHQPSSPLFCWFLEFIIPFLEKLERWKILRVLKLNTPYLLFWGQHWLFQCFFLIILHFFSLMIFLPMSFSLISCVHRCSMELCHSWIDYSSYFPTLR